MEKLTPEDIDNKILGVRIKERGRSISSFVASLQEYFPHYFKDIKFDEHSLKTEGIVVARIIKDTPLSEEVIYLATRYLIYMHYKKKIDWRAICKVVYDKNIRHLVDIWASQTGGTGIDSVTAVVKLISTRCRVDIPDDIDTSESLRKDMLMYIAGPAQEVIALLDREGVREQAVDCLHEPLRFGEGVIRNTHFCAVTRETLWMINSSKSANSPDNRLRMISSYMATKWGGIKKLGIINPHSGKYYTIAIEEINADKKEIIRRCIQGTDMHDRPANETPSSTQVIELPPDLYIYSGAEISILTIGALERIFDGVKKKKIGYVENNKFRSPTVMDEFAFNIINFITQYGQIDADKCSIHGYFQDGNIDTGHHLAHLVGYGNPCPPYQYLYPLLYKHQREGLNYTAVSVIDMLNGYALVCNISDVPSQVMASINKNVRIV